MKETIGQRIRDRRLELGYSQRAFAKLVNVSPATISFWENDISVPKEKSVVADALNTSVKWLECGTGGANSRTITVAEDGSVTAEVVVPAQKLPILTTHQVARWIAGENLEAEGLKIAYGYTERDVGRGSLLFVVPDQSMAPDFSKGDLVLIDPSAQPEPGSVVLVRGEKITNASIRLYRSLGLTESGEEAFDVDALNLAFPAMPLKGDGIVILGVAIEHRRSLIKK